MNWGFTVSWRFEIWDDKKRKVSRVEKKIRKHESLVVENEGMLISYLVIFWLHSTQNKMVRSCFFSWVWRSWKCSLVQHHVLVKNSCFGNWWLLVHSWSHSVVTILWDLQQSRSKLIAAAGPCCLRYPCTVLNWQRSALSHFWLMFCFGLFCFPTRPTVFSGVESNFKISTHVVCINIC